MKQFSKISKIMAVLLAVAMVIPGIAQAAPGVQEYTVKRLAGERRIETAIKASQEVYEDGKANIAILAGYSGEVDALTGTLLAGSKKAPLLLTEKNEVPKKLKAELNRLGVEAVYILGGKAVVSAKVEKELKKNYVVERVSGDNRAETADAIAKRTMKTSDHAFLALGYEDQLSDALAIGPVSAMKNEPVLLTKMNKIPKETIKTLQFLKVKDVTIVGGKTAVNESVVKELEDMNITIDRVKGLDRYKTAVAIAERYFENPRNAIVAYGWKYADALVGGYLGAVKNAPILLTKSDILNPETEKYLGSNPYNVFVLGGETVINKDVFEKIKEIGPVIVTEKTAKDAVTAFENQLKTKENVVALVNDNDLREEISKSHTTTFNKIQNVEDKALRGELLERLDVAHDRLISATSVKGLMDVTKNGVNEENLDNSKIKLSNAKTNIKKLKDDSTKDALTALVAVEEAKIVEAEKVKSEKEDFKAKMDKVEIKLTNELVDKEDKYSKVAIVWSAVDEEFRNQIAKETLESFEVVLYKDDVKLATNALSLGEDGRYETTLAKADVTTFFYNRTEDDVRYAWTKGAYKDETIRPNKVVISAKTLKGYEFTKEKTFTE